MLGQSEHERDCKKHQDGAEQPGHAPVGPCAQLVLGLEHQPGGAEQRVAGDQAKAAPDCERRHPHERATRELPGLDRQLLDHRADRRALHERDDERAEKEAAVPHPAHGFGLVAELERDASKDQPDQEQADRQIERRQEDCIDRGKGGVQTGADHQQPGLVAIPNRRDRGHHLAPKSFIGGGAEQNPDAEIEAVQDHVDQDAERQDQRPDRRQHRLHRLHSAGSVTPPGLSPGIAIGRFGVSPAGGAVTCSGPRRKMATM
jgi:hypothetical protein